MRAGRALRICARNLGPGPVGWSLALLKLVPGLVAFFFAFLSAQDEEVGAALFGGESAFTRLLAASAVSIAAAYVTVFPQFVVLLFSLRDVSA